MSKPAKKSPPDGPSVIYRRMSKALDKERGIRLSRDELLTLYLGDDAIWQVIDNIREEDEERFPCPQN